MAVAYTWGITAMKKAPSLDGLSDVITHVRFKYEGTDSDVDSNGEFYKASFQGACPLGAPSSDTFTPLANVTEANVVEWAKANHPVEHMQEVILKELAELKKPKNVEIDGMPWA